MISNLKSKLKSMSTNYPSANKITDQTISANPELMNPSDKGENPDKPSQKDEGPGQATTGLAPISADVRLDKHDRGNFGGEVICGTEGQFVLKRTLYHFDSCYGEVKIKDILSLDFFDTKWWTKLDNEVRLQDVIFLDTETTGLAGGTGTLAFLIGLGYVTADGFVVEQYAARDYDEELPMLRSVMHTLKQYKILISFNGKSFDWPLLETRLIYSRLRPIDWEGAHLDLLHIARRLWSGKLDSCSLTSLEENIIKKFREDDIPGALIPSIYLEYLNSRKTEDMQRVIKHNEWDIISMAAILSRIMQLYKSPYDGCDAFELYGIARDMEKGERISEAIKCYRYCITSSDNNALLTEAKKRLAYMLKRHMGPGEAVDLWLELASRKGNMLIFPLIEMAKYLEHKINDYQSALEYTEKAFSILVKGHGIKTEALKNDIFKRKERLIRKLERSNNKWGS